MRQLTTKQKQIIDKFIKDNTNAKDSVARYVSVFSGGRHILDYDDLPVDLVYQLEKINDTEILMQEINRYMNDECVKIIHA